MDLGVRFYTISAVCVKCLRNRCQESKVANLIFGMSCINSPLPLIKSEADYKCFEKLMCLSKYSLSINLV